MTFGGTDGDHLREVHQSIQVSDKCGTTPALGSTIIVGDIDISPTLKFLVQETKLENDYEVGLMPYHGVEDLRAGDSPDMIEEFMRVVGHTMKALNSDSWVAVQIDYMPFFPPGFGVGQVFPPGFWVSAVFPPFPQELIAFQVQWEKWAFGQVGFDRRTNLPFQLLQTTESGLWECILPSGHLCFLAVHQDFEEWGPFLSGDRFVAYQVLRIGCFQGRPLIAVPQIGPGSSLVKRWPGQTCGSVASATYELFAGIGGWHAGLKHFGEQIVIAVEIDPVKAQVLADTLGTSCVAFRDVRPFHLGSSIVLVGDVRDPAWFHVSLLLPAKLILWSAPCVTWSQGGRLQGLCAENGILLLDAIGVCGVFGLWSSRSS